jgi:type VI secretion system protein ImpC
VEERDKGQAQVHWLVAGRFGLGRRGRQLTLTRADYNEALEKAKLEIKATVPDRIGTGDTRTVSLKVDSLKVLNLKHIVSSVSDLNELLQKAEQVAKLKDPSKEDLAKIVGHGKLLDQLSAMLNPQAPAAPAADEPVTGENIFAKGATQEKSAKSAIDMFVRGTASSARSQKSRPATRQLRDAIETAAYGAAADILRSKEITEIEAAWRGLRFLVTECPKDSQMAVVVLETDPEHLLEDLQARERNDGIEEPDAIFVPHDYASTDTLGELADFAESELMPIVVGVTPSLFGVEDAAGVPGAFDAIEKIKNKEELPAWAATWDELRLRESTRWLCAVVNRLVVHSEGAGEAKRTAFTSGVWGLAAMAAASYRASGGFARIFGKNGSLRAPATWTIERGADKESAAPTEAFYAIAPSELLAKNGVLGLGSARNSDTLTLIKAPMVRGAKDAVPLPAQILTGRVVRFASWVKSQLPEGCDSKTANDVFVSAASIFLFPGQEQAAHVKAAVTNIGGEAHVVVDAAANPAIAGIPFQIAFPLPLNWSVPAPEGAAASSGTGNVANPVKQAQQKAGQAAEIKGDMGDRKGGVGLSGGGIGFDVGITKKDEK